jgi:hypothetical protein
MFPSWSCPKAVYKPVWHIPMLSVQWINSWWWTEELSETFRISCQNKFLKLLHLVGFVIKKHWTFFIKTRSVLPQLVTTVNFLSKTSDPKCTWMQPPTNKYSFSVMWRVSIRTSQNILMRISKSEFSAFKYFVFSIWENYYRRTINNLVLNHHSADNLCVFFSWKCPNNSSHNQQTDIKVQHLRIWTNKFKTFRYRRTQFILF